MIQVHHHLVHGINIMHKFNDRDYRNEPIQYKENVETADMKYTFQIV